MSVGPVFESHSLLILGWRSSLPRESAIWTLDSVPMFKCLCIPVRDVSVPLLSPPPILTQVTCPPGRLSRILSPFILFASSLSISVYVSAPPPAASGPSSSVCRKYYIPPADGRPMSSPVFLSSGPYADLYPPDLCGWWYLAWVWAEGRRRRRPPRWSRVPWRVGRRRPG